MPPVQFRGIRTPALTERNGRARRYPSSPMRGFKARVTERIARTNRFNLNLCNEAVRSMTERTASFFVQAALPQAFLAFRFAAFLCDLRFSSRNAHT